MGTRVVGRFIGVVAVALILGALTSGVAAAAPGCTDTYTGAGGGGWYTAAAWSAGHVPTAADSVCIPGPGVGLGNDSITVANLTIGSAGSLAIGDGGLSLGRFAVTGTLTNDGTLETSWGGTYSANKFVNAGTVEVPFTGFTEDMSFGQVINTGSFSAVGGSVDITLADGGSFDNSGGTLATVPEVLSGITFPGDIQISSPTPGGGTLELGADSVVHIDDPQTLSIADAVDITGGSICGAPLTIGSDDGGDGGALAFSGASASGAAPNCAGISGPSDAVAIANVPVGLSGTVPAGYSVTVGDDGISHATVTLAGRVVNDGTLQIGDGAEVFGHAAAATLVNEGALDVPSGGDPVALDTGLDNLDVFEVSGTVDATLGSTQAWANGTNGADATMVIDGSGSLDVISSPGQSAPFTQDGTIDNSGSLELAEPVKIAGGSICGKALDVGSSEDNLGGGLAWSPQLDPGRGCAAGDATDAVTVDSVPVTLTSAIPAGYTLTLASFFSEGNGQTTAQLSTPGPLVNNGTLVGNSGSLVTVNGTFTNRGKFTSEFGNDAPVTLTAPQTLNLGRLFANSTTLDINGSLENRGKVKIAGFDTELAVSGDDTQDAGGTLNLATPSLGNLVAVDGTATLAGTVRLAYAQPAGTQVTILTDHGTQGRFSSVEGPYELSYSPTGVTATSRSKPAAQHQNPAG